MGRIPEAVIQEVRDRADIVGLIGRYVDLKKAGRNFKGLCPFHDEKSPSFNVSPDRQIFHCFGCQAGGDVIGFLIKHENLTFPEALRTLAGELSIEIPETARGRESAGQSEQIFAATKLAQDCYHSGLAGETGEPGRNYLEGRGIDAEIVERFGLGFVPDRWDTVVDALRDGGISAEIGTVAGLLSERSSGNGHYDRLRGRVTFPISDVRGRIIAFGGRAISPDQEPKYLNTPETPVFQKRRSFYGFPAALEAIRRAERAIICEGYFDAIALCRAGLGEALATCGTALTEDHAKQLVRRTKNVSLLFDGDEAGQKAMERGLTVLLPEGLRVKAVALPTGQDPDDYLGANGAEALQSLVDAAPAALEVVIRRALRRGCSTPDEKADIVRHVATIIALVPNMVERAEWARRLAVATGVEVGAVEATVRAVSQGRVGDGVGALRESIVRPNRHPVEDRHLRHLLLIVARHPGEISSSLRARLPHVLPEGVYRDMILEMLSAAADGLCDASGGVDIFALSDRLSPDQEQLLREALVDEALLHDDQDLAQVVGDLVGRYASKQISAEGKDLTRRLQDPTEDPAELLRQKQVLLERKRERSRQAVGTGP